MITQRKLSMPFALLGLVFISCGDFYTNMINQDIDVRDIQLEPYLKLMKNSAKAASKSMAEALEIFRFEGDTPEVFVLGLYNLEKTIGNNEEITLELHRVKDAFPANGGYMNLSLNIDLQKWKDRGMGFPANKEVILPLPLGAKISNASAIDKQGATMEGIPTIKKAKRSAVTSQNILLDISFPSSIASFPSSNTDESLFDMAKDSNQQLVHSANIADPLFRNNGRFHFFYSQKQAYKNGNKTGIAIEKQTREMLKSIFYNPIPEESHTLGYFSQLKEYAKGTEEDMEREFLSIFHVLFESWDNGDPVVPWNKKFATPWMLKLIHHELLKYYGIPTMLVEGFFDKNQDKAISSDEYGWWIQFYAENRWQLAMEFESERTYSGIASSQSSRAPDDFESPFTEEDHKYVHFHLGVTPPYPMELVGLQLPDDADTIKSGFFASGRYSIYRNGGWESAPVIALIPSILAGETTETIILPERTTRYNTISLPAGWYPETKAWYHDGRIILPNGDGKQITLQKIKVGNTDSYTTGTNNLRYSVIFPKRRIVIELNDEKKEAEISLNDMLIAIRENTNTRTLWPGTAYAGMEQFDIPAKVNLIAEEWFRVVTKEAVYHPTKRIKNDLFSKTTGMDVENFFTTLFSHKMEIGDEYLYSGLTLLLQASGIESQFCVGYSLASRDRNYWVEYWDKQEARWRTHLFALASEDGIELNRIHYDNDVYAASNESDTDAEESVSDGKIFLKLELPEGANWEDFLYAEFQNYDIYDKEAENWKRLATDGNSSLESINFMLDSPLGESGLHGLLYLEPSLAEDNTIHLPKFPGYRTVLTDYDGLRYKPVSLLELPKTNLNATIRKGDFLVNNDDFLEDKATLTISFLPLSNGVQSPLPTEYASRLAEIANLSPNGNEQRYQLFSDDDMESFKEKMESLKEKFGNEEDYHWFYPDGYSKDMSPLDTLLLWWKERLSKAKNSSAEDEVMEEIVAFLDIYPDSGAGGEGDIDISSVNEKILQDIATDYASASEKLIHKEEYDRVTYYHDMLRYLWNRMPGGYINKHDASPQQFLKTWQEKMGGGSEEDEAMLQREFIQQLWIVPQGSDGPKIPLDIVLLNWKNNQSKGEIMDFLDLYPGNANRYGKEHKAPLETFLNYWKEELSNPKYQIRKATYLMMEEFLQENFLYSYRSDEYEESRREFTDPKEFDNQGFVKKILNEPYTKRVGEGWLGDAVFLGLIRYLNRQSEVVETPVRLATGVIGELQPGISKRGAVTVVYRENKLSEWVQVYLNGRWNNLDGSPNINEIQSNPQLPDFRLQWYQNFQNVAYRNSSTNEWDQRHFPSPEANREDPVYKLFKSKNNYPGYGERLENAEKWKMIIQSLENFAAIRQDSLYFLDAINELLFFRFMETVWKDFRSKFITATKVDSGVITNYARLDNLYNQAIQDFMNGKTPVAHGTVLWDILIRRYLFLYNNSPNANSIGHREIKTQINDQMKLQNLGLLENIPYDAVSFRQYIETTYEHVGDYKILILLTQSLLDIYLLTEGKSLDFRNFSEVDNGFWEWANVLHHANANSELYPQAIRDLRRMVIFPNRRFNQRININALKEGNAIDLSKLPYNDAKTMLNTIGVSSLSDGDTTGTTVNARFNASPWDSPSSQYIHLANWNEAKPSFDFKEEYVNPSLRTNALPQREMNHWLRAVSQQTVVEFNQGLSGNTFSASAEFPPQNALADILMNLISDESLKKDEIKKILYIILLYGPDTLRDSIFTLEPLPNNLRLLLTFYKTLELSTVPLSDLPVSTIHKTSILQTIFKMNSKLLKEWQSLPVYSIENNMFIESSPIGIAEYMRINPLKAYFLPEALKTMIRRIPGNDFSDTKIELGTMEELHYFYWLLLHKESADTLTNLAADNQSFPDLEQTQYMRVLGNYLWERSRSNPNEPGLPHTAFSILADTDGILKQHLPAILQNSDGGYTFSQQDIMALGTLYSITGLFDSDNKQSNRLLASLNNYLFEQAMPVNYLIRSETSALPNIGDATYPRLKSEGLANIINPPSMVKLLSDIAQTISGDGKNVGWENQIKQITIDTNHRNHLEIAHTLYINNNHTDALIDSYIESLELNNDAGMSWFYWLFLDQTNKFNLWNMRVIPYLSKSVEISRLLKTSHTKERTFGTLLLLKKIVDSFANDNHKKEWNKHVNKLIVNPIDNEKKNILLFDIAGSTKSFQEHLVLIEEWLNPKNRSEITNILYRYAVAGKGREYISDNSWDVKEVSFELEVNTSKYMKIDINRLEEETKNLYIALMKSSTQPDFSNNEEDKFTNIMAKLRSIYLALDSSREAFVVTDHYNLMTGQLLYQYYLDRRRGKAISGRIASYHAFSRWIERLRQKHSQGQYTNILIEAALVGYFRALPAVDIERANQYANTMTEHPQANMEQMDFSEEQNNALSTAESGYFNDMISVIQTGFNDNRLQKVIVANMDALPSYAIKRYLTRSHVGKLVNTAAQGEPAIRIFHRLGDDIGINNWDVFYLAESIWRIDGLKKIPIFNTKMSIPLGKQNAYMTKSTFLKRLESTMFNTISGNLYMLESLNTFQNGKRHNLSLLSGSNTPESIDDNIPQNEISDLFIQKIADTNTSAIYKNLDKTYKESLKNLQTDVDNGLLNKTVKNRLKEVLKQYMN